MDSIGLQGDSFMFYFVIICDILVALVIGLMLYFANKRCRNTMVRMEQRLELFSKTSSEPLLMLSKMVEDSQFICNNFSAAQKETIQNIKQQTMAKIQKLEYATEGNVVQTKELVDRIRLAMNSERLNNENRADRMTLMMTDLRKELAKKANCLKIIRNALAEKSNQAQAKNTTEELNAKMNSKTERSNSTKLTETVAAVVKESLNEIQTKRKLLRGCRSEENWLPLLKKLQVALKDEIHGASASMETLLKDADNRNNQFIDNVMSCLVGLNDNSTNRILSTTENMKNCMHYLYENQGRLAKQTHEKISDLSKKINVKGKWDQEAEDWNSSWSDIPSPTNKGNNLDETTFPPSKSDSSR